MKLLIGQILYLVPSSNMARGAKYKILEVRVESIGRKYGTIACDSNCIFNADVNNKFDLETLANNNGNYSPNYYLYTDYDDIYNKPNLIDKLRNSIGNLSYKELQIIEETINWINNNKL